ncbi:MAG TPA: HAD-IIIC family phosphatase [Ktedonobacteraceae bacterium]|nr:HAD-IIIC family phosphatase [Ktedonobacteraceae bacterium]
MLNEEIIQQDISPGTKRQPVKCVVWDLDHTLWDNVLLEDEQVTLRPGVVEIIKTLDSRGILNSIASKNDHDAAMRRLEQLGLWEYFLYPQINWNAKSSSIKHLAEALNIGLDALVFVDDQPFEREEVAGALPEVRCIDSGDLDTLLHMPDMMPRFVTQDSAQRRNMYLSDMARTQAEKEFVGASEAFLASLRMVFTIAPAREADLQRAEELTIRTHQLNTSGRTYSYEELDAFRRSPDHLLLIAGLKDRFGSYGKIGLALVEREESTWTIALLLMSCRVMSRGVGTILMNVILRMAQKAGVRQRAHFIANERNRMMYITYKFAGFREVERDGNLIVLEHNLSPIQLLPSYVALHVEELDI